MKIEGTPELTPEEFAWINATVENYLAALRTISPLESDEYYAEAEQDLIGELVEKLARRSHVALAGLTTKGAV